MWNNNKGKSEGLFPTWMRESLGPLILMATTLPLAFLLVAAMNPAGPYKGDLVFGLGKDLLANPWQTITDSYQMPDASTLKILGIFAAVQLAMMKLVPGNRFEGPTTATGHVPVYNANGLQCFFITIYGYLALSSYGIGRSLPTWAQYDADILYDKYPQIISFLSLFAFAFCGMLYIKGLNAPSSTDHGSSGNPVIDFYWGTELYPRIFGWDVKMFTNCRFGMMMWALLPISFAAHDAKLPGGMSHAMIVNLVVQLIYVAKFFWWESGYLRTIDIMHDRAGYYICWGCLVWVPSLYVSHSYFLSTQRSSGVWTCDQDFSYNGALALIFVGALSVFINYDADRQRAFVRAQDGKCNVWGSLAKIIRAKYTVELPSGKKEERSALLLASGWWGLARHFHYVPELAAAYLWCYPAGAHILAKGMDGLLSLQWIVPFAYAIFLTILLIDRAYRDGARCSSKYGKYYEQYKALVPSFIIPGVL